MRMMIQTTNNGDGSLSPVAWSSSDNHLFLSKGGLSTGDRGATGQADDCRLGAHKNDVGN